MRNKTMRTAPIYALALASVLAAGASASLPEGDKVFAAMKDEMARSMASLDMDNLGKPYFMSYRIEDGHSFSVSASFGGLEQEYSGDYRRLQADLRVGSPKFDNSHFASTAWGEYRTESDGAVSLDDNYDALRFALWSVTDRAYKKALETLSKKKAFVESRNITELYDDQSPEPVHELYRPAPVERLDEDQWKKDIVEISKVFLKYPAVRYSAVSVGFSSGGDRFLNSEGSAYRQHSCSGSVSISVSGYAPDGFRLNDSYSESFCLAKDAPPRERLLAKARELGENMTKMGKSVTLKAYIGPVLFEGEAAGEFFENLLVNNVANPREVWTEKSRWYQDGVLRRAGQLVERLGMRVTSPFLNVTDDPLARYYDGRPLAGFYEMDDEGVPARKIELVTKGKLTDYYRSRAATRDFSGSNGHGRGGLDEYPEGSPANVFIVPEKNPARVMPLAELKKKFMALCREEELDYCIRVDSLNGLGGPFAAWKVYADGREEPVHGIEFTGVTLRSLRDIAAVSTEEGVYGLNWTTPGSLVAPSILVVEMEIKKSEQKPEKLPYLPNPYFAR